MILDHLNSSIHILTQDKFNENKAKYIKIYNINTYSKNKTLFS